MLSREQGYLLILLMPAFYTIMLHHTVASLFATCTVACRAAEAMPVLCYVPATLYGLLYLLVSSIVACRFSPLPAVALLLHHHSLTVAVCHSSSPITVPMENCRQAAHTAQCYGVWSELSTQPWQCCC